MRSMCNPIPARINGVDCNADIAGSISGSASGYCSGFSYGNIAEDYWYHSQRVRCPALHPLVVQYSSLIYCPTMIQETVFQRCSNEAQFTTQWYSTLLHSTVLYNVVQHSAVLQGDRVRIRESASSLEKFSIILSFSVSTVPQATGPYAYNACSYVANRTALNSAVGHNVTDNPGFNHTEWDRDGIQDFGLIPSSRIYSIDPNFKSCPRSEVGPTSVTQGEVLSLYGGFWNVPEPENYALVGSFDYTCHENSALQVPLSELSTTNVSVTPW